MVKGPFELTAAPDARGVTKHQDLEHDAGEVLRTTSLVGLDGNPQAVRIQGIEKAS